MRTLNIKKTLITLLSVVAVLCMCMSAMVSVRATKMTKPNVAENLYAQGAHVDMATDGSEFYITFHSNLTDSLVSWLKATEDDVKVGALIGPAKAYNAQQTLSYDALITATFEPVCYLGNAVSDATQKVADLTVTNGVAEFTSSVRFNVNQLKIDAANGPFDADSNGAIDDTELDTMLKAIASVDLVAVPYLETTANSVATRELGTVSGARNAKYMLNDAAVNGTINRDNYSDIYNVYVGETTDDTAEYVVDVDGNVWKADENGDLVKDTTTTYSAYAGRGINGTMELANLTVGNTYGLTRVEDGSLVNAKAKYVTKVITDEEGLKAMKCAVAESKPSSRVEGYFVLANDITASGAEYGFGLDGKDFRSTAGTNGFAGTFDGRGHTISGLYAFRGGLFLHVNGGTIKNVAFVNCTMNFKQDGFFALTATNMTVEDVFVQIIPKTKEHTYNYTSGVVAWQHTDCSFTRVVVENNSLSIPSVDGTTVYQNVASFGANVDLTKATFDDCISVGRGLFMANDVRSTTSLNVVVDKNWTTNNGLTIGSANVLANLTDKLVSGGTGSYAVKDMPITTLFGSATTRPNIYFLSVSGATHYGSYDSMKADTAYDYANFIASPYWSVSATRELSWVGAN